MPPPAQIIVVKPLSLDFGVISAWAKVGPQTITLVNPGSEPVVASVTTNVNWLEAPSSKNCPAGLSQPCQVSLKKTVGPFARPKGRWAGPRAVEIAVAGQVIPVSVTIEVT